MAEYSERALEALLRDTLASDVASLPLRLRPADVSRQAQVRRRGRARGRLLALAAALALLLPMALLIGGSEAPVTAMTVPRAGASATVLQDGRVLIAGGWNESGTLDSAEILDPSTGRSTATGTMSEPRSGHAAVLLEDGSVLVVGGSGMDRYDPATGSFRRIETDLGWPDGAAAARLGDGRVFIKGGERGSLGERYASVFDPETEELVVQETPAGISPGADNTIVPLDDGRVLVAGDRGSYRTGRYPIAAILDTTTGEAEAVGPRLTTTEGEATAGGLADGRVVLALPHLGLDAQVFLFVLEPATGAIDWAAHFPVTSGMVPVGRLVTLSDGRVLVPVAEVMPDALAGPLDIYAFDPRTGDVAVVASGVGGAESALAPTSDGSALLIGGASAEGSARADLVRVG